VDDRARRARFAGAFPAGVLLTPGDTHAAEHVLQQAGVLEPEDTVTGIEQAGRGNMNLVLRATLIDRSVVIKQARPWVERYPQIEAPPERSGVEAAFYRAVARAPAVAMRMPGCLGGAPASGALVLEDLGRAPDLTHRYAGRALSVAELDPVISYLRALHRIEARDPIFANRAMRRLNHTHIFDLPLSGAAGPDLDGICPGLEVAAGEVRSNAKVRDRAAELGAMYLEDGRALLHGDVHPGSVLVAGAGSRVIDPEFCFLGPPEFELGVLGAHILMTGATPSAVGDLTRRYREESSDFDPGLMRGFAGMEIIRRIIGVAQLPLEAPLERRCELLEMGSELLLDRA